MAGPYAPQRKEARLQSPGPRETSGGVILLGQGWPRRPGRRFSGRTNITSTRRPWHAATSVGALAHHAFELGAGTGLVFQPYLGLGGAAALWGTVLPCWFAVAARGSTAWDRVLAFATGMSLGAVAMHFTLWPWRMRRGVPLLLDAEGLRPNHMRAYNAILYAWGIPAAVALLRETPAEARHWGLAGAGTALLLRPSARYHFRWVGRQAAISPAWWNRALAG
jgi:hypothetical protein